MDLIEVYIQEVTRRLPKKMRDDIAMELRSNIEDMLPAYYSKDDVKQALEKLGNPAVLAAQYKEQPMHLIGPKFYEPYISILKLVVPIALTVVLIVFMIENMVNNIGNNTSLAFAIISLLGEAIWMLLETAIQVFFWVTITFIILERTIEPSVQVPLTLFGKKWAASDLEKTPYVPLKKAIKKSEVVFSLFWTIIWVTLYFNANTIIGIYEKSEGNVPKMTMPIFNQDILMSYWVIIVGLAVLEILRTLYKARARQWTYMLAISNAFVHLVSFVVLVIIIQNADILHPKFVPYMVNLTDVPLESMDTVILWITWTIIVSVIVTGLIDIFTGFRKARIKG